MHEGSVGYRAIVANKAYLLKYQEKTGIPTRVAGRKSAPCAVLTTNGQMNVGDGGDHAIGDRPHRHRLVFQLAADDVRERQALTQHVAGFVYGKSAELALDVVTDRELDRGEACVLFSEANLVDFRLHQLLAIFQAQRTQFSCDDYDEYAATGAFGDAARGWLRGAGDQETKERHGDLLLQMGMIMTIPYLYELSRLRGGAVVVKTR